MSVPKVFENREKKYVLMNEAAYKRETIGPNAGQLRENLGFLSFRTYTDKAGVFGGKGVAVQFVTGKDDRNRDRGKYVTINQSHNAIITREGEVDIYGKEWDKFVSNSPYCEGSPNGHYVVDAEGNKVQVNAVYKLLNTEGDAEIAMEASIRRSKAQLSASEIDEQTLIEVATIGLGRTGKPGKMMRHEVIEWAGKRPQDYFDVLNSGDRQIRGMIRKAIADGIFTQKGDMIYWGQTLIGTDEDRAVGKLTEDPVMLDALKEKVDLRVESLKKMEPKKPAKTKNAK